MEDSLGRAIQIGEDETQACLDWEVGVFRNGQGRGVGGGGRREGRGGEVRGGEGRRGETSTVMSRTTEVEAGQSTQKETGSHGRFKPRKTWPQLHFSSIPGNCLLQVG